MVRGLGDVTDDDVRWARGVLAELQRKQQEIP